MEVKNEIFGERRNKSQGESIEHCLPVLPHPGTLPKREWEIYCKMNAMIISIIVFVG